MAKKNNIINMMLSVARNQGLTPAETQALIATARQESGLNPNSVGDNGSSFGLFQMHVGGAGGPTLASARQYLDPMKSIQNRAQFFKQNHITTGAGAAALQRPYDPQSYARSVDALLHSRQNGSTVGGSRTSQYASQGNPQSLLDSPRKSWLQAYLAGPQNQLSPSLSSPHSPAVSDLLGLTHPYATDTTAPYQPGAGYLSLQPAFAPDPVVASLMSRLHELRSSQRTPAQASPSTGSLPNAPSSNSSHDYKFIQHLGQSLFGLKNDPGTSQTTGGHHATNSLHYSGKAVDFGNARNSQKQLDAWYNWAKSHAKQYGFGEVFNEGNHIHVGF
jgi:hypothetical protein